MVQHGRSVGQNECRMDVEWMSERRVGEQTRDQGRTFNSGLEGTKCEVIQGRSDKP
jgi:hypothetical protein